MTRSRVLIPAGLILALGLALSPACVIDGDDGGRVPLQEKTERVALEGADSAQVSLHLAAGRLVLRGADSPDLFAGSFRYNRSRLEPSVDVTRSGSRARVAVRHRRRGTTVFGRIRNNWDVTLSNRVPLEIELDCGAGETELDLRGLDLESLNIDMGVGALKADLTGDRKRSLSVAVDGGVGEASFDLPAAIGVRVEVDGGLGSVNASGFAKSGRVYTNEAWGKTPVSITVSVDAGIGSVNLRQR